MSPRIGVGFAFQPDPRWEELCGPCLDRADVLEVSPETLWVPDERPGVRPNAYFRALEERLARRPVPVVGHGIAYGLGSESPADAGRREQWLERLVAVRDHFRFGWTTEHLGTTWLADRHVAVPLAVPAVSAVAELLRGRLDELGAALGTVGLENAAFPYPLATPEAAGDLLTRALGDRHVMVLDLHNLWCHALEHGADPRAFLDRAPLHRVVELHVSGGSWSDARWLPSGRVVRLDSHDGEVPDPVLALVREVVPRCPALRVVVLERLDGTVAPGDVDGLLATMDTLRALLDEAPTAVAEPRSPAPLPTVAPEALAAFELAISDVLHAADPGAALRRLEVADPALAAALGLARAQEDLVRVAALLVAKTRFERAVQGSHALSDWFARDARGFTATFRRWHEAEPSTGVTPLHEAGAFLRWLRSQA